VEISAALWAYEAWEGLYYVIGVCILLAVSISVDKCCVQMPLADNERQY